MRPALILAALLLPGFAPAREYTVWPLRSVMIVEIDRARDLGAYEPPDARSEHLRGYRKFDYGVKIRLLAGQRYPRMMKAVMPAPYRPGTRLLVIAEPRRDGRRGFFRAWAAEERADQRFCIPEKTVVALDVGSAFADVPGETVAGERVRCVLR